VQNFPHSEGRPFSFDAFFFGLQRSQSPQVSTPLETTLLNVKQDAGCQELSFFRLFFVLLIATGGFSVTSIRAAFLTLC